MLFDLELRISWATSSPRRTSTISTEDANTVLSPKKNEGLFPGVPIIVTLFGGCSGQAIPCNTAEYMNRIRKIA